MAKHYTKPEIEQIREMAKTMTRKEVAEILGRPVSSITNVAFRTGISFGEKCQRRYSAKDLANIIRCKAEGMTYRQVAEATGVNFYSCMYLHRRYG
ncbi:hypothetical protein AB9Q52_011110 [Pantoea vagans]|uniref:hypothetical protein n=1 Tax=Pantoea vagans TaxID=470934 RepID=UPI003516E10A